MSIVPVDWNVVVPGAWNIAILTPEGIAKRLFQLESNKLVEIQVPLEQQAPIRVVYNDITVVPSNSRLVIAPNDPTPDGLDKAASICIQGIQSLPETPMNAAGINLRFKIDSLPEELLELLTMSLDEKLSDANYSIVGKVMKRSITWNEGILNIEIHQSEDISGFLLFNFHRSSTKVEELTTWLSRSSGMITLTKELLNSMFNLKLEGDDDE
ncbi:MAG: hypothetical protein GXP58_05690 [Deltaproteobacteria bacterium]|nr:hypothetical protein [Deltaproteobacteria bacterium]